VIFSTVVCGAVFFMGLMRSRAWIEMLRTSISLVIAAVPEGLPTIGTTTMAIGVADMKKKNVFVRRLNVLENLASIEILCLDKTGTLTMNDMIAEGGYFAFQAWHRRDFEQEARTLNRLITGSESLSVARRWSMIAALCTDCERLSLPNELGERWVGSSTEKAIIQIAELMGADFESQQLEMPRFKVSYRTEARQYMVTYHKLKDTNVHIAAVKGNPDQVLDLCAWLQEGVSVRAMDADAYQRLKEQNKELAQRGLRVLGFAYVEKENLESIKNRKIIWLGSVGLMDPMREGMTELIEKFHVAGIKAIMLTGDQTETAEALGIALGFNKSGRLLKTIDARMLSELSLDEIADLAEFTQVFSRVSPSDKLRIVKALQGRGKIVAMTGDGINDSPALKAAHVGIALGFQGSSAARESADIVLKDDNLQILYHIIEKGRSIRTNLQKSIKYLLATNLSEIVLMFVSIGLGRGSPLNAVQLLWINLLTDILPGLALALDPPAADCMQQGPSSPYDSLINERARYRLLFEAGLMGAGALFSYEQSARQGGSQKQNTSATFISLTVSQILHTLSASAGEKGLIYGDSPRNRQVYIAMSFASTTLFLGLVSPWFRSLLGNEGLPPGGLRKAMGHGAWPFVLSETFKIFANHNRTQSLA
ncbi:MAG: HAD-IC family P-type ATPase, partial [Proteobacteria bacterium]|nr:HAD-IC family P-type ATPase [Pseudomonadota bacterium]